MSPCGSGDKFPSVHSAIRHPFIDEVPRSQLEETDRAELTRLSPLPPEAEHPEVWRARDSRHNPSGRDRWERYLTLV